MFKTMRRQDRQLSTQEAERILSEGEYGILSTVGANGYAYGVPLSYAYQNGAIYFHAATEGQKLDNLRYCNKVSFCVVGKTQVLPEKFSTRFESVVAYGTAAEIEENEKQQALLALVEKYSPEYRQKGQMYIDSAQHETVVCKIIIEHITGKGRK
ncbi:hypothetical protein P22_0887 [Propionispora sp. 2/2-37]|uniref:pyridoxamine 5'-phosphate oxidase family protein n=1 Tax=Propionispora sp. 2/2-37 TaxID=1677858 RepID=UPI0006BB963D|nr:pyridoxamine 5'-phosphate oxidase family protein [Propionispora sp. 2/2-37]CUH94821.1 hypothetical protein P22_0887 [Propionispora sp. 2/2-37]